MLHLSSWLGYWHTLHSQLRYRSPGNFPLPRQCSKAPISLPKIYTVKVALAWDSKVATKTAGMKSSVLTVDFDLIVRDSQGVEVALSPSWDDSYEIAKFPGVAGEICEIIIRRWSGTDNVWFGLAWNVTSRLIFLPPLIPGLE